ncbi:MAG TPA: hypothetical protein VF253_05350 [Candidatus Limnocylindrales bacterium]
MPERPSAPPRTRFARNVRDPIVVALALVLRDIAEQRAAVAERRRTMTLVEDGKRGGEHR